MLVFRDGTRDVGSRDKVLWGGKYEYAGKGATKKAMRRRRRVSVAVKERTITDMCRRRAAAASSASRQRDVSVTTTVVETEFHVIHPR